MSVPERQAHWQNVYTAKGEKDVSWFQESPTLSLAWIAAAGSNNISVIDIGGGASRLVDALLARRFRHVTVLDVSGAALRVAQERIGAAADTVRWIAADVTTWEPTEQYDVWHDRAAFHFLTAPGDRDAYVARLKTALRAGGQAVVGTFSPEGPERCSGLPVVRYDARSLAEVFGPEFRLLETRSEDHRTPWGASQRFQFSRFRYGGAA